MHAQSAEKTESEENAKPKPPPRLTLAQIRAVVSGNDKEHRKNAVAQLRTMANKGDTLAQTYLADLYFQGRGVVHNYPLAAYWYEVAAKRGNTDAQFKLAGMYRDNIGVVQTGGAVRDWLMKAAEGGHGDARKLLLSQGVTPPPVKPIAPMTAAKEKPGDKNGASAEENPADGAPEKKQDEAAAVPAASPNASPGENKVPSDDDGPGEMRTIVD